MCFKDEVFKKYITANPGKNHKEIMGLVGAAWKTLSETEK